MSDHPRHGPLSSKVFHVLLALRREPLHGYGLKKSIRDRTNGDLDLDPGGLYRLIARLEDDGWVREVPAPESADDTRRRYYALTDEGLEVLRREAQRLSDLASWDEVVDLARGVGSV